MWTFLSGIPLTMLGLLLVMTLVHAEGLLFYIGVVLAPASYLAGYVTHQVNVTFWILSVLIQFVYYFLLVCLIEIIRAKKRGNPYKS